MKKFINAKIELISFEMTDIITTSNPFPSDDHEFPAPEGDE